MLGEFDSWGNSMRGEFNAWGKKNSGGIRFGGIECSSPLDTYIYKILFQGSTPFQSNGPKSLPAGPQVCDSNGPLSLHNNNKNWNPFEDMKSFAEMTEEALVDQEFDQLRSQNVKKTDPFQSAPFEAVKQ